jgi:hypothetical protein
MKILEDVRHQLSLELPRCKSHSDIETLFIEANQALARSQAPIGQRRRMWEDIRNNLSNLIQRPHIVSDARSAVDRIMKEIT